MCGEEKNQKQLPRIIREEDVRQRLLKNNPLFSNGKHFTPHVAEAVNPIDSSKAIYN